MYSGQRRSAGSAQVSGEQVPEMDGSMALMATEEGAGTGEVVALAGARVASGACHGTRIYLVRVYILVYNWYCI